ncbi:hypothetical protein Tco_0321835 [Tanacetum coccineum]
MLRSSSRMRKKTGESVGSGWLLFCVNSEVEDESLEGHNCVQRSVTYVQPSTHSLQVELTIIIESLFIGLDLVVVHGESRGCPELLLVVIVITTGSILVTPGSVITTGSILVTPGSVITTGSILVTPGSVITTGSILVTPGSVITTGSILVTPGSVITTGSYSYFSNSVRDLKLDRNGRKSTRIRSDAVY